MRPAKLSNNCIECLAPKTLNTFPDVILKILHCERSIGWKWQVDNVFIFVGNDARCANLFAQEIGKVFATTTILSE